MAEAIVSQGYLWAALLVILLAAARPVSLFSLRRTWDTQLAIALGLGIFLVAMFLLWPSLCSGGDPTIMASVMP